MSYKQLYLEQRYTVDRLLKQGRSYTFIADTIGVHKSTVSRGLSRNKGKRTYNYRNTTGPMPRGETTVR